MGIIEDLKNKAAGILNKQDQLAEKLANLADKYIAGDEESTIEFYKAEELYKKYGEAYYGLLLTILKLQEMQYTVEDLGKQLQLN
jgi:hypothetical protein